MAEGDLGASALQSRGYTVLTASNGEEALAMLETRGGSIDAMVMDMVMPRMNGSELLERMGDDYPKLSILCTSGYAKEAEMRRGSGAWLPFLPKPYRPSVLLQRIRELLDA